jgi:hypothetical protein
MKNTPLKLKINLAILIGCAPLFAHASPNSNFSQLNDTGISYGGDFPKGINSSCTGKILPSLEDETIQKQFILQQDCSTGTSAEVDTPNNSAFRLHKVSSTGQKLSSEAPKWQCVTDEISGLMWEVKHNDADKNDLHHVSDKFTWYNSDPIQYGGNIGDWNRHGAQCQGYDETKPRSYCHIEQFASRVNKAGLCGFNDWRVPTRSELTNIIHFGKNQPAIDSGFFPNTLNNFYWTWNPIAKRPIEAWAINFEFGFTSPLRKTDLRPVRLVRSTTSLSKSTTAATTLKTSSDGSFVDTATGLVWQRCLLGQSGDDCEFGTPQAFTWAEALTNPTLAIPKTGEVDKKDWRLPNIRELASIVELGNSNPAINSSLFPNSSANQIWSSSPYQFYSHYAWFLDFNDGIFNYGDRQDKKSVRLVRDISE